MAELTPNQKETIAAIERQFMAINETKNNIPFSVVDINKLNVEVKRIRIGKSELEIHENAMRDIRTELRDKLIEKLNADFKAGEIQLTAQKYLYNVLITLTKTLGTYTNAGSIEIHINTVETITEFGRKTIGFEYSDGCTTKEPRVKFNTPEELFATPEIEARMIYLIEKSMR